MLHRLTLLFALLFTSCAVFAQDLARNPARIPPRPLASALEAMARGDWTRAEALALRDGPAAAQLIEWHRLRAGQGTPSDILRFLQDNPDWPGLVLLRRKGEALLAGANPHEVLAFYTGYKPQTGLGALSLAVALRSAARPDEATDTLIKAWLTLDLSKEEHDLFLQFHKDTLAPHHEARLDMALWRGLKDARYMLPLVSKSRRAVAEARLAVEEDKSTADAMISALSQADQADAGLAHALFNRHIRRNETQEAIQLILQRSARAEDLGQPARWAGWRRVLARSNMQDGNPKLAYDLASSHQLHSGSAFANLEWLSGYIALTYLDQPKRALDHFRRFQTAVKSPISLGRAGYWTGRALEALNDTQGALEAYRKGAKHQTSFYGLLSAERAGVAPDPALRGGDAPAQWRDAAFAQSHVFQAGVLAFSAGRRSLAEQFFVHLSDSMSRDDLQHLGAALQALEAPHLQVMLGKAAARRGIVLPGAYYALHPLMDEDLSAPAELALSIARRESEFDPVVVSGAGAQGLMQVLPGTASDVARDLGLTDHDARRVLSDWRYNARLGSAYLAQLADQFDGNILLISAGYNAGPARPPQWITRFGDPRSSGVDVVDWIEHIPFRETRNYVMRVAESVAVYRARLGKEMHPIPFSAELKGATFPASGLR